MVHQLYGQEYLKLPKLLRFENTTQHYVVILSVLLVLKVLSVHFFYSVNPKLEKKKKREMKREEKETEAQEEGGGKNRSNAEVPTVSLATMAGKG